MNLLLNITSEPTSVGVADKAAANNSPVSVISEHTEAGAAQERIAFSDLLQHRLSMQDLPSRLQKGALVEPIAAKQPTHMTLQVLDSLITGDNPELEIPALLSDASLQELNVDLASEAGQQLASSSLVQQNIQAEQANLNRSSPEVLIGPGITEPDSGKILPAWAVTEPPQVESGADLKNAISMSHNLTKAQSVSASLANRQQNSEAQESAQKSLMTASELSASIISTETEELPQNGSSKHENWMTRSGLTAFWRLAGDGSVSNGAAESKKLPIKAAEGASSSEMRLERNESIAENTFEFDEVLQWSKWQSRASAKNDVGDSVLSRSTFAARSMESSASVSFFQSPVLGEKVSVNATVLDKALPMFTDRFADALGAQSLSLAKNGSMSAELRLDPPDLGPLDIQIDQDGLETKLHFIVHQSQTKEHVEAALHRLRDIFESGGLKLTDVTVEHRQAESHGSADGDQHASRHNNGVRAPNQTEAEQEMHSRRESLRNLSSNLFDEYA